jgi:hypothetical protein
MLNFRLPKPGSQFHPLPLSLVRWASSATVLCFASGASLPPAIAQSGPTSSDSMRPLATKPLLSGSGSRVANQDRPIKNRPITITEDALIDQMSGQNMSRHQRRRPQASSPPPQISSQVSPVQRELAEAACQAARGSGASKLELQPEILPNLSRLNPGSVLSAGVLPAAPIESSTQPSRGGADDLVSLKAAQPSSTEPTSRPCAHQPLPMAQAIPVRRAVPLGLAIPVAQAVSGLQAVPAKRAIPVAQAIPVLPSPSNAELQAQITNLQAQISALQAQLSGLQAQLANLQPGRPAPLVATPYGLPQSSGQYPGVPQYPGQPPGQYPGIVQAPSGFQPSPGAPLPPLPMAPAMQPGMAPAEAPLRSPNGQRIVPVTRSAALNPATLRFQGAYIYQQDRSSARARVTGVYPLSRSVLVGGSLDLTDGRAFSDSPDQGLTLNELYVAFALPDTPTLRFLVGQLDLTSYFDRNSFAKDGATHFFNSTFQTNPALNASGIASRQAALVNWSISDNFEAKAAVFSSDRDVGNFSLDGFAGELAMRYGNFILRGTYVTNRDAGSRTGPDELFQIEREPGRFGLLRGDREDSYGINAEIFVPDVKLGLFGRYGHYSNRAANVDADTWMAGASLLDVFFKNDRLGVAYGQRLTNDRLRRRSGNPYPDVFEVFYDMPILEKIHLGFSFQGLDGFRESFFGVRVRADLDLFLPRRLAQ